jgi:hypothetical protein
MIHLPFDYVTATPNVFASLGFVVLAFMGNILADISPSSTDVESWSLKGILIVAIGILVRELQKERQKSEALRDTALKQNTDAYLALKAETEKQTTLFTTFASRLIQAKLTQLDDQDHPPPLRSPARLPKQGQDHE